MLSTNAVRRVLVRAISAHVFRVTPGQPRLKIIAAQYVRGFPEQQKNRLGHISASPQSLCARQATPKSELETSN